MNELAKELTKTVVDEADRDEMVSHIISNIGSEMSNPTYDDKKESQWSKAVPIVEFDPSQLPSLDEFGRLKGVEPTAAATARRMVADIRAKADTSKKSWDDMKGSGNG